MMKLTMAAVAAITAIFLLPGLAHAGTVRGTVVAKQANRHVLVVAMRHRQMLTARVTARQLQRAKVGNRLALVGTRLADNSLRVKRLHRIGSAKRARLAVVVLKARGRSLLVAGGGSAFSIRLNPRTRLLASRGSAHPGEKMNADVHLTRDGPVGEKMDGTGDAPAIDFSGVVTAMDATSITVSEDGIDTVVQLPDGIVLPPIVHVGSEVEIVATISGSTLTLATIKLDDDNAQGDDNGGCSVDDQGRVEVEGSIATVDAHSITIQPGASASPATFAIPDGFTLPEGLVTGSVVEARGELVDNVLTLHSIELKHSEGDHNAIEVKGTVTHDEPGSITIQAGEHSFTFAVPDNFTLPDGLAVGSLVEARGELVDGALTLTELELHSNS